MVRHAAISVEPLQISGCSAAGSCEVAGTFEEQIRQCYSQKKAGNEHDSFGVGWTDGRNMTDTWHWSSSSDLDG